MASPLPSFDPPEAPELGPRMLALRDDRQRRFAWLIACGYSQAHAAREAGYSDHLEACKVRGCMLMQSRAVVEAVEECAQLVLRGMGPIAVEAAHRILRDIKHRDHAKMVIAILDRTGFAPKTEHTVKVQHTVDTKELEALARRLAAESGIDPMKLLGSDAKVIEHETVPSDPAK